MKPNRPLRILVQEAENDREITTIHGPEFCQDLRDMTPDQIEELAFGLTYRIEQAMKGVSQTDPKAAARDTVRYEIEVVKV